MFKSSRSLAALAGIAAGVASAAAGPSAGAAQPAEPQPPVAQSESGIASHGTCLGWTRLQRQGYYYYLPTTSNGSGQTHCVLRQGNNTSGVFKLEDALKRCYPQFSGRVTADNHYGEHTAAAVKQVQNYHRIPADAVYGPQTGSVMEWPRWDIRGGDHIWRGCRSL